MTRLIVGARAALDVDEILERLTELAGVGVAEKYAQNLRAIYGRLEMFPASGARRRSLGQATRIAIWAPYVVVYDQIGDDVVIVRVIDGRRNLTLRLVRE